MQNIKLLFGNSIRNNIDLMVDQPVVSFYDYQAPSKKMFSLGMEELSRHVLLVGGTGSGKTNVINLMYSQLKKKTREEDIFIIFDTKGDYYKEFGQSRDIVLGNSKKYRDISYLWNIFDEVLADGEEEEDYSLNAREISSCLFKNRGSQVQPFFVNAARDIFAEIIIYFIKRAQQDLSTGFRYLNNQSLCKFILEMSNGDVLLKLSKEYTNLKKIVSYLGKGDNNQSLGVIAELKNMINDCFIGVFCKETKEKSFSIRNEIRKKNGKTIYIEYDIMTGEILTPIYSTIIDLALKEALGRSSKNKGNVYFILDELKLLPKLAHLDDALNFGRGLGVKVIAGVQSLNQLFDVYGDVRGKVIAGSFLNVFAFYTNDSTSRDYITQLFGKNVISYNYVGIDGGMEKNKEREGNVVESWTQDRLKPGEAIIRLFGVEYPFHFVFQEYK